MPVHSSRSASSSWVVAKRAAPVLEDVQATGPWDLVSLWQELHVEGGRQQPVVIFATVTDRQEDNPAPKSTQSQAVPDRLRTGLRICGQVTATVDDWLRAALQAGNHADRGEMVLLQSQGSNFAYAPVLKALQRAQMPLAKFLVYPASVEDAEIANTPASQRICRADSHLTCQLSFTRQRLLGWHQKRAHC